MFVCFYLSILKLWFYFQTLTHLRPLTRAVFKDTKNANARYLLFVTFVSSVASLNSVISGGFLAEDEKKPKLVSAHPQPPK